MIKKRQTEAGFRTAKNGSQRRFFWLAAVILLLAVGVVGGRRLFFYKYDKTVVFRISTLEKDMDYDMQAAVNYLKYRFEKAGYDVLGTAYPGKLYPRAFDFAAVNVFVRGFTLFFDMRMNPKAANIYYLHRFTGFYAEEMRHYDYYISSQRNMQQAVSGRLDVSLLPSGAVPHEPLKPHYDYDVLYIYEYGNETYEIFLQYYHNPKIYSGMQFAALSAAEKAEELAKAKLVVYEMGDPDRDDDDYVPYAVYDLISYGRPVATNYKLPLSVYFGQNVFMFNGKDDMYRATAEALALPDDEREKRAEQAHQTLSEKFDFDFSLLQKL